MKRSKRKVPPGALLKKYLEEKKIRAELSKDLKNINTDFTGYETEPEIQIPTIEIPALTFKPLVAPLYFNDTEIVAKRIIEHKNSTTFEKTRSFLYSLRKRLRLQHQGVVHEDSWLL